MKLIELEPEFIIYKDELADKSIGKTLQDGSIQWGGFSIKTRHHVSTLQEAQGIMFLCPLCFNKNNGSIGTHLCEVSFKDKNVKDDEGVHDSTGRPVRWGVSGNNMDDLTTTPSVFLQGGCKWHGFITLGEVSII